MFVVVSTCIHKDDKILVIKEGIPNAYGLLNLPGGKLDDGEGIIEGAKREAKEETGLNVKINGVLSIQRNIENNHVRIVFNAEIEDGEIQFDTNEILEANWYSISELEEINTDLLREKELFLDNIRDIKRGVNYPLELIKSFY